MTTPAQPAEFPEPPRTLSEPAEGDRRKREFPPEPEALEVAVYDNHTHLDLASAEGVNAKDHLDKAKAVGVKGVLQIGVDLASSRWGAEIATLDRRVLAAVALHPNEAPKVAAAGQLAAQVEELAAIAEANPRVRVIGETGLDFFRTSPEGIADQVKSFEAHIDLAKQLDLVLQIHDRDAHREILETLDRVKAPERVVLHCYSGDREFAEEVARRGYYFSFAGTVTFKNAEELRESLKLAPKSRLLVETDAPFLTPHPHRGKLNGPYLVPHIVRSMAETLNLDERELATIIADNTEDLYGSWDA